MAVREAVAGDAPGIAKVHVRSWQVAYRGQLPDALIDTLDVEARTEAWRRLLAEPAITVLVDEHGDHGIVGFVAVGASRDDDAPARTGEVQAIYVDPSGWGRGTGSRLLGAGLDRLAVTGHRHATLWVLETNHRTRRFCEGRGWSPDGQIKHDERGEVTLIELRYARPLRPRRGTPGE